MLLIPEHGTGLLRLLPLNIQPLPLFIQTTVDIHHLFFNFSQFLRFCVDAGLEACVYLPLDVIILRLDKSFVHLAFILFDLVEAEFVVEGATIILTGLQGTLLLVLIKLSPLNLCQHLTYHPSLG